MQKTMELQWPFRGLDESTAFARQKGGQQGTYTTAKCLNVLGFDPTTGRNRGSSRAGTSKYCPDRINGAAAGQCLVYTVGSIEKTTRDTGPNSTPPSESRVIHTGEARRLGANTPIVTGGRTTTLVGVADGTVATITPDGLEVVGFGTAALSSARKTIFAEPYFKNIFFCDGANYKYYDPSENAMLDWSATTGGTMPSQETGFQLISDATNATPIVVTVASHGLTEGDQVTITEVLGNTAANGTWSIESVTTDTFALTGSVGNGAYTSGGQCARRSGSRCSLIAVWGGRIVLSGLDADPNNIFMSAVGDPFDFDYSPAVQTVQQAVAGNVTNGYGKNADIVTALIPYTDDVLLIGGSTSINRQLGNPAEGGINVSITDITGIAYGKAWCQSPEGVIYFYGSRGGVYRIDPENGIPSRLTSLTVDERLADINLDNTTVTLLWDDRAIAVRVYITPHDGSDTTHYVWDVRNEAWWPFSYTDGDHNPLAVHSMSGNTTADRRLLEYGQDGYIRMVDLDASTDDGNAITSYVYLGPFSAMMFVELDAVLSDNSDRVTWAMCSASSMERALTAAPRLTGRLHKGRNATQWTRAYIENGYLRLSSTGSWAMESLMVVVDQVSQTMSRVMRSHP
jgi:hypothetical protein